MTRLIPYLALLVLVVACNANSLYVPYNGPPMEEMLNHPNPLGDWGMMQGSRTWDENKPMAGMHHTIVWSNYYQAYELCWTVAHYYYRNWMDALSGKVMDPGDSDVWESFYPKLGRPGCWQMIGVLRIG